MTCDYSRHHRCSGIMTKEITLKCFTDFIQLIVIYEQKVKTHIVVSILESSGKRWYIHVMSCPHTKQLWGNLSQFIGDHIYSHLLFLWKNVWIDYWFFVSMTGVSVHSTI